MIRLDFHTVQRCCKFIIACCTLHNLCILYEDELHDLLEEVDEFQNIKNNLEEDYRDHDRAAGEEKRNFLCQTLQ